MSEASGKRLRKSVGRAARLLGRFSDAKFLKDLFGSKHNL